MISSPKIRRGNAPAPVEPVVAVRENKPPPPLMHGDDTLSPVDLPGSRTIGGHPLRWTSVTIYLAAAVLLLLNAATLSGWAAELSPGPRTARVVAITDVWERAIAPLGMPHATMHGWWKAAQAARFGSERAE